MVSAWLKRFGLHLAAAVGATGIFVAAAAVGATQTRQHVPTVAVPVATVQTRTPGAQRKPSVVVATPSPSAAQPAARTSASPTPTPPKVVPERSLTGTIKAVRPDGLDVLGAGGHEWQVTPAPGALIRLNGKAARLDGLQAGDTVVILGQALSGGSDARFLAHAITVRRK